MSAESDLQVAFEASAFHRAIKGRLHAVDGGVVLAAEIGAEFSIALGRIHGGVVASLLDTAATWALIATTGRPSIFARPKMKLLAARSSSSPSGP